MTLGCRGVGHRVRQMEGGGSCQAYGMTCNECAQLSLDQSHDGSMVELRRGLVSHKDYFKANLWWADEGLPSC